ncbi:hypothetical protein O181_129286 [Austropuccinia psidii MF-1]|uniref:Integrase catalytic domain-containing protein n=1 Tax=Austropuccinia psidii MF-1 TaxID=1389203 RepID=A0A9Q3L0J4_9BASI|nr:hypothetical protein [Austropuccinia psidii MF-1]
MYSFVAPLRSCSDFPSVLRDWIELLCAQCNNYPKTLQTDNAKEFISASFCQYISSNGIIITPSLPYSPQENGEAERLNCTLGDMACSMFLESNLSTNFGFILT